MIPYCIYVMLVDIGECLRVVILVREIYMNTGWSYISEMVIWNQRNSKDG